MHQKSILEHVNGSMAATLLSLLIEFVTLVVNIGRLFLSMGAMRGRQTRKAFHQRIEQGRRRGWQTRSRDEIPLS